MVAPIYFALAKIDRTIVEAAGTLGASRLKSFYHIIFKMSAPGVVIGIIFVFISAMSDFATPRIVGGYLVTIGLNIAYQVSITNWPLASALAMLVVVIILFFIFIMLKIVDIKRMIF